MEGRVKVRGNGFLQNAVEAMRLSDELDRLVKKAMEEAMAPPPPGLVKVHLSLVIAEELLADEVALGHFLVRQVKEKQHGR